MRNFLLTATAMAFLSAAPSAVVACDMGDHIERMCANVGGAVGKEIGGIVGGAVGTGVGSVIGRAGHNAYHGALDAAPMPNLAPIPDMQLQSPFLSGGGGGGGSFRLHFDLGGLEYMK